MKTMNRRLFIKRAVIGGSAVLAMTQIPRPLLAQANASKIPIGFQTFPIRDLLAKDFAGTLKMMAQQGYQLVEMCSPKGYADIGFGPLVDMKTTDMRRIINEAGLNCPSCHFGFAELTDNLDDRIDFAHQLGLTQMICSSFNLPKTATLNDYLVAADKLNQVAEKIKKANMQAGYHNHELEFQTLDGQLLYDALMQRLNPALVKMQFQTEVI